MSAVVHPGHAGLTAVTCESEATVKHPPAAGEAGQGVTVTAAAAALTEGSAPKFCPGTTTGVPPVSGPLRTLAPVTRAPSLLGSSRVRNAPPGLDGWCAPAVVGRLGPALPAT